MLIAEDNDANIDVLDRRQRRRGFATILAHGGREAFVRAAALLPVKVQVMIRFTFCSILSTLLSMESSPSPGN